MSERAAARPEPVKGWFRVNRDYEVLSADTDMGIIVWRIGERLWDVFPGSEPVFGQLYEQAWSEGQASGRVFYAGFLVDVWISVHDDAAAVSYEVLEQLDALTLRSLSESLARIREHLASCAGPPASPVHRHDLGGLRLAE